MKIGIVAPEFPPDVGGMEVYALEIARELVRRGHEVTVFTIPHASGELEGEPYAIVPCLALNYRKDRGITQRHPMDMWHVMTAGYAWIALEKVPVVVSVHGNDFLGPSLVIHRPGFRERMGLPFGDAWDFRIGRWMTRRLMARGFAQAKHVFTNSRYTQQEFLKRHHVCSTKVSCPMVGVSEAFLETVRPAREPGPPRLITICRLSGQDLSESRKNVDGVIRALATLKDRFAFSYTVVGKGGLVAPLQELARTCGLSDRVHFTGYLGDAAMRQCLARSDLFVLAPQIQPGSHEGFGIVYLEANACGTPALGVCLAGVADAIREGVSGFFAKDPSVESIAAALESFFSGDSRFDADACRRHALEFRWERVVDQMVAHYPTPAKMPLTCAS